jgi:hypothetical protein
MRPTSVDTPDARDVPRLCGDSSGLRPLPRQRRRIIRRRIDLERGGGDAGHGERADRGDQRHQALEPHRFFRSGVARV